MSLEEKLLMIRFIEKMQSLLNAITEQNKITTEFLAQDDILKAKESVNHANALINEFNKVMFL